MTPAASDPPPLSGASLVLAGFALALANFVVILDITIANVALPHISGSLGAAPSQGTWVITSYAIAEAISVPLTGWLAGRFGAVRVFVTGLLGFGLFSLLCGLAPNLPVLIVLRVLQGLCGGPIMPMSQALVLRVFPRERVAVGLGLWSIASVLAPIAGPVLGGVISDEWSWPWIFYINIPVVALCTILALRTMRGHETSTARNPIDFVGLVLLVVWVAALQVMLDKGREEDWFASEFIAGLGLLSAVAFVAFLIWELTDRHPVVDLSVLRHRGFAVGTVTQSVAYGAFFAQIVLVPLWLQTNLGYTATWAGFATAFLGVLAVMVAPVAANLVNRFDARYFVCFGILWLGGVSLLRTGWATEADFFTVSLPQFLQGLGMPFFFIGTMTLALGSVQPRETAAAAGILNFMRTLAGAVAVSVATTTWEHEVKWARAELAGVLNGPEAATRAMAASGLSAEQARSALDRVVEVESVTLATNAVFLGCAAVFALAAALVWLAPRPRADVDLGAVH